MLTPLQARKQGESRWFAGAAPWRCCAPRAAPHSPPAPRCWPCAAAGRIAGAGGPPGAGARRHRGMAETDARPDQLLQRLQRTRIEAPFDGVVLAGDSSRAIGSPVEQGKPLFTLAPLAGCRVALKVDERDVPDIAPGQPGADAVAPVGPAAAVHGAPGFGRQHRGRGKLFLVDPDLDAAPARLRPWMEEGGKIDAGHRTLLWVATHRLVDWVRVAWWRYMRWHRGPGLRIRGLVPGRRRQAGAGAGTALEAPERARRRLLVRAGRPAQPAHPRLRPEAWFLVSQIDGRHNVAQLWQAAVRARQAGAAAGRGDPDIVQVARGRRAGPGHAVRPAGPAAPARQAAPHDLAAQPGHPDGAAFPAVGSGRLPAPHAAFRGLAVRPGRGGGGSCAWRWRRRRRCSRWRTGTRSGPTSRTSCSRPPACSPSPRSTAGSSCCTR